MISVACHFRSQPLNRFVPMLMFALLALGGPVHAQPQPPSEAAPAAEPDPAGAAFLAKNAKAPGVKTLPSGLQYKVITSGTGDQPKAGDVVKVAYEGTLVSGTVFDSSFARGKPILMRLYRLVPAWMEAIPLMHVGDEWMVYAPPELGYGAQAAGPIPPNSVLIFRIKLIGMLSAD
jgi:FKBP-type peptidyl-prolyl cis-trans isomerase FklB